MSSDSSEKCPFIKVTVRRRVEGVARLTGAELGVEAELKICGNGSPAPFPSVRNRTAQLRSPNPVVFPSILPRPRRPVSAELDNCPLSEAERMVERMERAKSECGGIPLLEYQCFTDEICRACSCRGVVTLSRALRNKCSAPME